MSADLEAVTRAVEKAAECPASHVETVAVVDTFRGQAMWDGAVEVFALLGHPKAQRAYAWETVQGDERRFTVVLEISPVKNALDAVRASIVSTRRDNAK